MAGSSAFRLLVVVGGAVVVAATAAGVVLAAQLVAPDRTTPAAAASVQPRRPPTAASVAGQLGGVANAHATLTGAGGRIERVSCIAGDPGSYACSYVRTIPGNGGICAVALVRWTPNAASTYAVRTAGRVALPPSRCGPVAKVLHVLGTSG